MRLCRYLTNQRVNLGVYADSHVIPIAQILEAAGKNLLIDRLAQLDCLLPLLPPDGELWKILSTSFAEIEATLASVKSTIGIPVELVTWLPPIAGPNKLLLLAGNYTDHIHEQGDRSAEREHTFPYVFSKPPSTALMGSGGTFIIPKASPNKIDYELELGVVIGRGGQI